MELTQEQTTTANDSQRSSFFTDCEIETLNKIEKNMEALKFYFKERNDIIEAMFISLLSKQHLCMVGPPGTGKSYLITSFCQGFGFNLFQYQLSKFTTPEELMGPFSLISLKKGKYERITENKIQECDIAYLDEIFNGNSAICNKLNEIMNERLCEGRRVHLQSIFSGTNFIPGEPELIAFWDRFLFRFIVSRIAESSSFKDMLIQDDFVIDKNLIISRIELESLQQKIDDVSIDDIIDLIIKLRSELEGEGIYPSDRRFKWAMRALKACAILHKRKSVIRDDLFILKSILFEEKKQIPLVEQIIARIIAPALAKLKILLTQANEMYKNIKTKDPKNPDDLAAIMETREKLQMIHSEINTNFMNKNDISDKVKGIAGKIIKEIVAKSKKIEKEKLKSIY